ncbi:MAG: sigma-54-dependent Fis family transcriptional regulator, partial [Phycisphaerales bacterium]
MGHRSRADIDVSAPTSKRQPWEGGAACPAAMDADLARRAAQADCTILITGETGVGKGNLAKWLHMTSRRSDGPFVPVNCAAIPESIIDSQLFGHARGAFSGATTDHPGLIRAAEYGTLLLDEVSELPPSAQSRLLRLLQEREVQPVGYPGPVTVDVRVVAATNIDLEEAVAERRFREDLLFRLDVIRLHVKPLRQRGEELPILLEKFNCEFARLYNQPELEFDDEASEVLRRYPWPGNVR